MVCIDAGKTTDPGISSDFIAAGDKLLDPTTKIK